MTDTRAPVGVPPRMTEHHEKMMADLVAVAEKRGSGNVSKGLRQVSALVTELASGRLGTYSTESEVRVSRNEVEEIARALDRFGARVWAGMVRGWLVSTKQEVSE